MILGTIGIVVALIIFLIMMYRNVSLLIAAPICVVIVALTNGLNVLDAFTNTYVHGMMDLIPIMFSIIFFGVILGKVYADTGCANAIAHGLMKRIVLNKPAVTQKDNEKRVYLAILAVLIFVNLCNFGGIDGYVLMFTAVPIFLIIAQEINIPRRFIPAMIFVAAGSMAAPGAPQITNVIAVGILQGAGYDVTAASGLVVGIIGFVIITFGCYLTLTKMIIKAQRNGESFEMENVKAAPYNPDRKLPNFYLSFLPLILVFVIYTVLKQNIATALLSGIVLALIIGGAYIEKVNRSRISSIKDTLGFGSLGYPNALVNIITPAGLAAVITATVAFGDIKIAIGGLSFSPYIITFIAVAVIVCMTASPPAALMASIPLVIGVIAAQGLDVDMGNVLRIAVFTSITFESLPWNGMIVQLNQMTDSTHKKSYLPIFLQTVAYTTAAALIAVVINLVVPNLP